MTVKWIGSETVDHRARCHAVQIRRHTTSRHVQDRAVHRKFGSGQSLDAIEWQQYGGRNFPRGLARYLTKSGDSNVPKPVVQIPAGNQ